MPFHHQQNNGRGFRWPDRVTNYLGTLLIGILIWLGKDIKEKVDDLVKSDAANVQHFIALEKKEFDQDQQEQTDYKNAIDQISALRQAFDDRRYKGLREQGNQPLPR
jgi:hypothetical protein